MATRVTRPIKSFIHRYDLYLAEPEDWEDFDGDEDVIDLRAYSVMGPIFHLNLLQLPPQPKNVADWVMTIGEYMNKILHPL